jgi:hypothetical protein
MDKIGDVQCVERQDDGSCYPYVWQTLLSLALLGAEGWLDREGEESKAAVGYLTMDAEGRRQTGRREARKMGDDLKEKVSKGDILLFADLSMSSQTSLRDNIKATMPQIIPNNTNDCINVQQQGSE